MTDRATTTVTTATATKTTTTSSTADPKNSDVRKTSPDLVHKTNNISKNTLSSSPSSHVGHSNSTFPPGSTYSNLTTKTLYNAPYDTPGMRMSVSAVLAGSGRDSTYYRGATTSPKLTTANHPSTTSLSPPTLPLPRYDLTTVHHNKSKEQVDKSLTNEQLVRALTSVPPEENDKNENTKKPSPSSSSPSPSPSKTTTSDTKVIGNALAAVAATVAQQQRNTPSSPISPPPLASPSHNTAMKTESTGAAGATATAIGNLAANISTILQANGVQKQQQQQRQQNHLHHHPQVPQQEQAEKRRPSALQLTQIIDQAIRFGVQNNQRQDNTNNTVTMQNHTYDSSPHKLKGKLSNKEEEEQQKEKERRQLHQKIVRNEKVWEKLKGLPEKRLGCYLYSPGMLLPINETQINGLIQVVIPARYLTYENPQMKQKAIWGTDIYTDDSDIVSMIVHSGKYEMTFVEPEIDPRDPFFLALGVSDMMAHEDPYHYHNRKKRSLSTPEGHSANGNLIPEHDLKVTLRVMPTLRHYTGTIRNFIGSRTWNGDHDGASYWVENVEKIQQGDAQPTGRHGIKASMNKYAYERYLTVGPPPSVKRRWQQLDQEEHSLSSLNIILKRSKFSKTKKKAKVVTPSPPPPPPSVTPSTPTEQPASPATSSRRRVRRAAAKNKR